MTDYESVGRGFESLSAYQKNRYPFRDNGFSNFYQDSNDEMQQSGGLLLDSGWTESTPYCNESLSAYYKTNTHFGIFFWISIKKNPNLISAGERFGFFVSFRAVAFPAFSQQQKSQNADHGPGTKHGAVTKGIDHDTE